MEKKFDNFRQIEINQLFNLRIGRWNSKDIRHEFGHFRSIAARRNRKQRTRRIRYRVINWLVKCSIRNMYPLDELINNRAILNVLAAKRKWFKFEFSRGEKKKIVVVSILEKIARNEWFILYLAYDKIRNFLVFVSSARISSAFNAKIVARVNCAYYRVGKDSSFFYTYTTCIYIFGISLSCLLILF